MKGLFKSIWYDGARHLYRILSQSEYSRYNWLVTKYGKTKRFIRKNIRVHGWNLIVPDVASFLSAYREIFVEEIYAFPRDTERPLILDCGANIGISILYFKKNYPKSQIIAYEADPEIFSVLQKNIHGNGIEGVELINKAIWSSETDVLFSVEGGDGGRINNEPHHGKMISVPSVSLLSLITLRQFDLVKIDIEGAEVEALSNCGQAISKQKRIFVEFHSFRKKEQKLGSLIEVFQNSGFRVHIHPPLTVQSPFMNINKLKGVMDMQLNLYFWRDEN